MKLFSQLSLTTEKLLILLVCALMVALFLDHTHDRLLAQKGSHLSYKDNSRSLALGADWKEMGSFSER